MGVPQLQASRPPVLHLQGAEERLAPSRALIARQPACRTLFLGARSGIGISGEFYAERRWKRPCLQTTHVTICY
jgi:hypothetical protein